MPEKTKSESQHKLFFMHTVVLDHNFASYNFYWKSPPLSDLSDKRLPPLRDHLSLALSVLNPPSQERPPLCNNICLAQGGLT